MRDVNDCLSTVDAAALLDISPRTLEGWRLRNTGPKFSRLGPRIVRYVRGDLVAWMEQNSSASLNKDTENIAAELRA